MMQPEMLKSLTQLIQDLISSETQKKKKKKKKNRILFVKFIENEMGQQIAPINKNLGLYILSADDIKFNQCIIAKKET